MAASNNGHLDLVGALLEAGADPNMARSDTGCTALIAAAVKGSLEVVRALLAASVDPNTARSDTGCTALIAAASYGSLEVVQYLVANGADVGAQTIAVPPLPPHDARSRATSMGHAHIAAWLDAIDGYSPFHVALVLTPAEVKALLRKGVVDPDECAGALAAATATAATSKYRCQMEKLLRLAVGGWSRYSHWLHKDAVRAAVAATLTTAARLSRACEPATSVVAVVPTVAASERLTAAAFATSAALPLLPPEIWEEILNFLARRHW
jgi:hypothetical protein